MVDIIQRSPTPSEYNSLRQSVGWPTFQEELITMGMSKTIYSIIAVDESGIVGMGRIIGDGAIYFHIQDVVIRPDYQGAGVGTLIMDQLMKYLQTLGGVNTNIGLMCSVGREPFYEKFGFKRRPAEQFGAGMIMIKK